MDLPVLIAGGGPVGLAASICLSRCGVRSLLVERHSVTTQHPRATVVNTRTMELFRGWGLAEAVVAGGVPMERMRYVVWATTLRGFEIGRLDLTADHQRLAAHLRHSPVLTTICAQDIVEPALLAAARRDALAEIHFDTELEEHEDLGDRVGAVLLDRRSGERRTVEASYLIAADGSSSPVREKLGIALRGLESLGELMNIYFHADLTPLVEGRAGPLYWIINPEVTGVFIALNGSDRWLLNVPYRKESGESEADFPLERCIALVRRAAGDASLAVEVRAVRAWTMTRLVAESYRRGNVFLAGDAAHQFPPTGGLGMNCGIQDAHNLAWKIAAVVRGWAAPSLLDSYEHERRPVAEWYTDTSARNAQKINADLKPPPQIEEDSPEGESLRRFIAAGLEAQRDHFDSQGAALGFAYRSDAVIDDGTPPPPIDNPVLDHVPTGRPGHRAPHVWLRRDGAPLSTLDLFANRFTLLAGPGGETWVTAARNAAKRLALPLHAEIIGGVSIADPAGNFLIAYGLDAAGAVLVRPDGHIGWRSRAGNRDVDRELDTVLARLCGRSPQSL